MWWFLAIAAVLILSVRARWVALGLVLLGGLLVEASLVVGVLAATAAGAWLLVGDAALAWAAEPFGGDPVAGALALAAGLGAIVAATVAYRRWRIEPGD